MAAKYDVNLEKCALLKCVESGSWIACSLQDRRQCAHLHLLTSFPVAQMVEHGASNAKIMGSIPRESKSW